MHVKRLCHMIALWTLIFDASLEFQQNQIYSIISVSAITARDDNDMVCSAVGSRFVTFNNSVGAFNIKCSSALKV